MRDRDVVIGNGHGRTVSQRGFPSRQRKARNRKVPTYLFLVDQTDKRSHARRNHLVERHLLHCDHLALLAFFNILGNLLSLLVHPRRSWCDLSVRLESFSHWCRWCFYAVSRPPNGYTRRDVSFTLSNHSNISTSLDSHTQFSRDAHTCCWTDVRR